MSSHELLSRSRAWSDYLRNERADLVAKLATGQAPRAMWVGCADSRIPAEQVLGLDPGDLFVHRNIAAAVHGDDYSARAAIDYGVRVLQVRDLLLVGHHGCGGVAAALDAQLDGPLEAWLHPVAADLVRYRARLDRLTPADRLLAAAEIHLLTQLEHLCANPSVHSVWEAGGDLAVHGWVYRLADVSVQALATPITSAAGVGPALATGISQWQERWGL